MKLLMIGCDGVKAETFNRGWTPFIQSLIDKGHSLHLKEDLISRGWSEIVTGRHAVDTGALYEGPHADGSLRWGEKFRLSDVPGLGTSVKPIWQTLNENGYRVGIMNVPTTYPAPEVNGFFVSGGGGGGPITQRAAPEQCHPQSLAPWLNGMDYIVDERMPTLLAEKGLYAPDDFFSRLDLMTQKRTKAFIDLANKHSIDFGFIVYRSTVTAETLLPPELDKLETGYRNVNHDFISAAKTFYQRLDEKIRILTEAFPRAEVLLVSDHSMDTRRYAVNSNGFLVESGYQVPSKSKQSLFGIVKSFKHLVPHTIRARLKKNRKIQVAYESMTTFDSTATKAFSMAFSNGAHGIYINDTHRFGGPVPSADIEPLVSEIIDKFNSHPLAQQHGFNAYPRPQSCSPVADKFPDIVIDLPDGYQTSNRFSAFVVETPLPTKPFNLRDMHKDPRTTGKAHTPLAVNTKNAWKCGPQPYPDNLTAVYRHILEQLPAQHARDHMTPSDVEAS